VNGPAYPLVPIGIEDDLILLEGHRVDIVGPIVGDHATSAGIYVPSLQTLAVGDVTFHDFHVFTAHHVAEERAAWLATLDELDPMDPAWVIPGRSAELPERNADSIAFTRDYLIAFEEVFSRTRNPRMIVAEMQRLYPDAKDVLGDLILQSSAIVAAGLIPPIDDSFRQRDLPTRGPGAHSHAPHGSPSTEGQD